MKTVVTFDSGAIAIFEGGAIDCPADYMKAEIDRILAGLEESPSMPDFDYTRAALVCDSLPGKITLYEGPPDDQEDGVVY